MGGSCSDTLTHHFPGWTGGKNIILGIETLVIQLPVSHFSA